MSYSEADVFVICYSTVDTNSLENVVEKWAKDLLLNKVSNVPKILVGTKTDLLGNKKIMEQLKLEGVKCCTVNDAEIVMKKIGAFAHVLCSSLNGENVNLVFTEICKFIYDRSIRESKAPKKKKIFSSVSKETLMDQLSDFPMLE